MRQLRPLHNKTCFICRDVTCQVTKIVQIECNKLALIAEMHLSSAKTVQIECNKAHFNC